MLTKNTDKFVNKKVCAYKCDYKIVSKKNLKSRVLNIDLYEI